MSEGQKRGAEECQKRRLCAREEKDFHDLSTALLCCLRISFILRSVKFETSYKSFVLSIEMGANEEKRCKQFRE